MSHVEIEQKENAKTQNRPVMIQMEIDETPISTTSASAEFQRPKPRAGHTYRKEFKVLITCLRRLFYVLAVLFCGWCFYEFSQKIEKYHHEK